MLRGDIDTFGVVAAPQFFLVGTPRSGTTLLRSMLATNSAVAIPGETGFLPKLLRVEPLWRGRPRLFVRLAFANQRLSRDRLTPDEVLLRVQNEKSPSRWIDLLYRLLVGDDDGTLVIGDKTPNYGLHWALLHLSFPQAKFITIIRDPRDVVRSLLAQQWGPRTAGAATRLWVRNARETLEMQKALPQSQWHTVRYEDLVDKPTEVMQALCDFLNLHLESAMIEDRNNLAGMQAANFHPESHTNLGASVSARPRPPMLRQRDLQVVNFLTNELASEFGYGAEPASRPARGYRTVERARDIAYSILEQKNRFRTAVGVLRGT